MVIDSSKNAASPLLLLGVSRSGTTLLQRILNSYDDVIIWGEHAGYLTNLVDSYYELVDSSSMKDFSYPQAKGCSVPIGEYKNSKQWQAWNNWFKNEDMDSIYRELVRKTFASDWINELRYWGFKEVRYGDDDRVVDFFLRLFPDVKIVIVYRNPMNVIESQLSSFENIGGKLAKFRKLLLMPKIFRMAKKWKNRNLNYLAYAQKYPNEVIFVSFENYIADIAVQRRVMDRLCLPFTGKQSDVLGLSEGRGSAYRSNKGKKTDVNSRWKKLGVLPALCVWLITRTSYREITIFGEKGFHVNHE